MSTNILTQRRKDAKPQRKMTFSPKTKSENAALDGQRKARKAADSLPASSNPFPLCASASRRPCVKKQTVS
jgi:hypothetical protein